MKNNLFWQNTNPMKVPILNPIKQEELTNNTKIVSAYLANIIIYRSKTPTQLVFIVTRRLTNKNAY